jgi:hypothetical protein
MAFVSFGPPAALPLRKGDANVRLAAELSEHTL